jgi:hypothetical protein
MMLRVIPIPERRKDMFLNKGFQRTTGTGTVGFRRQGRCGNNHPDRKEGILVMERFLDAYIERVRPQFPGFPPATAHEIASAFLAFRYGLYAKAVAECSHANALIPDGGANAALKKALDILRAHAMDRDNSLVNTNPGIAFSDAEQKLLPIDLPQDRIDDPGTFALDNSLILVWVVALITSPDDEETMGEHRKLIVRMLADYKKALGLG